MAYYAGALIVMGAMGLFMNHAWEQFGDRGLCAIALSYATVFLLAGNWLWRRPGAAHSRGSFGDHGGGDDAPSHLWASTHHGLVA